MAEERILITTRHKNEKLNMTFTSMYKEYTRQEAIEKMNKAACKANKRCIGGICETCTSKMPHEEYTHQNEAALNALLEGE